MMSEALNAVAHLYSENLETHGVDPKSVGWRDEASQRLRFAKLAEVIDPATASSGITVNDLGCGYGAMFRYLDQTPPVRLTQYFGYDISEEMLLAAERYAADPRATFERSSRITHQVDYSFVSGTFNVRFEESDEAWTAHMTDALLDLSENSRRGFAFNALSTYVDWKQENLYYADPFFFFDFCKRNISRYVSLLHDYPLFEWTMIVRKEEHRSA
jgi:SAM-dependent methyltransferase